MNVPVKKVTGLNVVDLTFQSLDYTLPHARSYFTVVLDVRKKIQNQASPQCPPAHSLNFEFCTLKIWRDGKGDSTTSETYATEHMQPESNIGFGVKIIFHIIVTRKEATQGH